MGQQVNKSYCLGIEEEQGAGWYERDGTAHALPEACLSNITVFDTDGQPHSLVLDQSGYIRDISGRESASGSSVDQPWKDDVVVAGTGGTDIVPELTFRFEEGEKPNYYLKHFDAYLGIEPYEQSNRDETGYDDLGFPTDFAVNLTLYADGNPNTYVGYSKDISLELGTIGFSQDIDDAHSLYLVLTANMAQHIITSRNQYFEVMDEPKGPDDTLTTEMNAQGNINDYDFCPYPVGTTLTDLYDGEALTGDWTAADDPASGENAQEMDGSETLVGESSTYSGDFSFAFFLYTGATFPFTVASWTGVSIIVTEAAGVYTLRFTDTDGNTDTELSWDGGGWVAICVVRDGTDLSVYEGTSS